MSHFAKFKRETNFEGETIMTNTLQVGDRVKLNRTIMHGRFAKGTQGIITDISGFGGEPDTIKVRFSGDARNTCFHLSQACTQLERAIEE